MIFYLFSFLENFFLVKSIFIRFIITLLVSIFINIILIINFIKWTNKKNIFENIRDLGFLDQKEKKKTPTMGGLIIIISTLIPTILLSKLDNIYIIILIFTTLWMGIIGFIDDYIKIFKKNKSGLTPKFKIIGQIILGIVVGLTLYYDNNNNLLIKENFKNYNLKLNTLNNIKYNNFFIKNSYKTTMIFKKNNEIDYMFFLKIINKNLSNYFWIIFISFIILVIISVSNGANLTDGIDGLSAGTCLIIIFTLVLLSWFSSDLILSKYFNIMYIPNIKETIIFSTSLIGSLIGFLCYNIYPAKIFMGDTGSLTIGSIIAVLAIIIKKELLLPLLCIIFLIENLSVIIQVTCFKYFKWRNGLGYRLFLMAPLHHHFQKKKYHENKITSCFLIIQFLFSIIIIIFLKLK